MYAHAIEARAQTFRNAMICIRRREVTIETNDRRSKRPVDREIEFVLEIRM